MNEDPQVDAVAPEENTAASSRRSLLRAPLAAAAAALPWALAREARAAAPQLGNDVLVMVNLRGGMDGLSTVVPYGDPDLEANRRRLRIPPPGSGEPLEAIDLDGFFGFAPAAAPLMKPYQNGHLAVLHAAGSVDESRSHFESIDKIEFGVPGQPLSNVTDGWMARHLALRDRETAVRALAVNVVLPKMMHGAASVVPSANPARFKFPGDPFTARRRRKTIERMFADSREPQFSASEAVLDAIDLIAGIDYANYVPEAGAEYPDTLFGLQMQSIATTIKADVGVELYSVDLDGWDTHGDQGPLDGYMARLIAELSQGMQALYLDLGKKIDHVNVVVFSEFGRRPQENISLGTDHGHGGAMLAMGGAIAGGRVIADWPGLSPDDLTDYEDLKVTTDYRDVIGEILKNRLGNDDLDAVFPNHVPNFVGVTRS